VYPEQEVVISLLINASNPKIQAVLEEKLYPLFLVNKAWFKILIEFA